MTRIDKVVSLLERLPLLPDARGQIESWANKLAMVGGVITPRLEMPWSRNAGIDGAERSLHSLNKQIARLLDTIDAMPSEAVEALDDGWETAIELRDGARRFLAVIIAAEKALAAMPPTKTLDGRRAKLGADVMTTFAAKAYTALTGKRPTVTIDKDHEARGQWIDFVTSLFAIFEIDASPVAQARKRARRLANA